MQRKYTRSFSCLHCATRLRPWQLQFCSESCYEAGALRETIRRFWLNVDKSGECWLWTGSRLPTGYGTFSWFGRRTLAHRFSYELEHGAIPAGLFVCHRCNTPPCVRPDHLYAGTQQENLRQAHQEGRLTLFTGRRYHRQQSPLERPTYGEHNPGAKLTEEAVREIRALYATGDWRQVELARHYQVRQDTISDIVNHVTWRHLP